MVYSTCICLPFIDVSMQPTRIYQRVIYELFHTKVDALIVRDLGTLSTHAHESMDVFIIVSFKWSLSVRHLGLKAQAVARSLMYVLVRIYRVRIYT
jgi:hypothetical protein